MLFVCVSEREEGGRKVNVSVLPVREGPSWDCWGCVGEAACEGRAEILEGPGEEEIQRCQ